MAVTPTSLEGVFVKGISTADLFTLQDIKDVPGLTEAQATREFGVALMLVSACDAEGELLWPTREELLALPAKQFMATYEIVCSAALEVNGLGDDVVEDEPGND